ncbi:mitochondrial ornithine transporter 1-like protein [Leishmania infantum JPCM5]|uniref:Mitochondrial_ornithine_transporter_1-like_protei n n=2 Tax=Leishmania infantum TaxID=5671 RepID=A0A6L0WWU1_LEIIN|nr:mitochondrial ornithine transporter 1-like protein [Leishmania infantum JPCM5]CAC9474263.1 mitochondrial_ornithine_transporter_1-like_protein [Leishmania infantum]CAM66900.1 mitochondrial ornithine transporter 1-like protein [Leishmania infantum JPCM5]SUZ40599.1 mitochondrial_ornithine_transporter_1-like_protein [Leishmania infantum]|eukprot:XP_001464511.1 mitochondrial ornithine transporter 1-like protein [Leishmania infantum JPCM5]
MTDAIIHLTAGTVAGMTGVLLDYPLDTVKTRMQVSRCAKLPCRYSPTAVTAATSLSAAAPATYWQCASQLYRRGGIRSFYCGLSVPLAAQGAETAVVFSVYNVSLQHFLRKEQLQRQEQERARLSGCRGDHKARSHRHQHMHGKHEHPQQQPHVSVWSSPAHWKASACAGLAVSLILTPVEMLKCNMQMESARPCWRRRHTTARGLARHLMATHGLRGLYTGVTGTVTRAVLGNMAYFVSYEQCREWLAQKFASSLRDGEAAPIWHSMLAGGISGCCYWSVAYPADVAKTKMQVCPTARQQGFTRTLASLYRSGGVEALFRGWGVTVVRAFLSSSIVFTTHEHSSSTLRELSSVYRVLAGDSAAASASSAACEPEEELISHRY